MQQKHLVRKLSNRLKAEKKFNMANKLSTRDVAAVQEKRVAKKLGGYVNSNSGAGRWDKSDVKVHDASLLIECKTTMTPKKSFSIKKEWLDKTKDESFANRLYNRAIAFNFDYEDKDDYYVIDDKLMKFLVEKLIEENE